MISGRIGVNEFFGICLILEAKLGDGKNLTEYRDFRNKDSTQGIL